LEQSLVMAIQIGDKVDDLALLCPNGTTVHLSAYRGSLVLIFLRHLH
jgi:hypothetical protein